MKKIGFIGLGTMGLPMAQNLLNAGFELVVYNRTKEKAAPLLAQGAVFANSPSEVARNVEAVFTMVTADAALEEVIEGKNGIAVGAPKGLIVIDSSTVSPLTSTRLAKVLEKQGIDILDAPVSGSEPHAKQGSLAFMVGGKKNVFDQCEKLFAATGKQAFYMGDHGAGSQTKLAINTIVAINITALSEGTVLAQKAGIDPSLFLQVVQSGGAKSGVGEFKGPKIVAHDFQPQFAISLMLKDLRLAGAMASDLQMPTPLLGIVRELMQTAVAKGFGQEDMMSIVKCYEEWANLC